MIFGKKTQQNKANKKNPANPWKYIPILSFVHLIQCVLF